MSQTIDIISRQVIENQSNMADNDILDLEYVPKKTSRFEKAVADVSAAEAKPVQASKDAIGNAVSTIQEGDFITYDPQMPLALEIFADLDKSLLLKNCWVPLNWDEKGVVVLVDDPSDLEKRAVIKAVLRIERVIFAVGIKEDIEAFINRSFSQLEIDDFLLKAMSGEEPVEVPKLVDIIVSEAYTRGTSDIYFESSALSGKNRVFFWMDGVYREFMTVPEAVAFDVVKRIKTMANLDVCDRELAKVGHLKFYSHDVPEVQITVTTYPIDGLREDVVLRILAA